jgi:DNA-binding CsgD family transcriptional regulator
VSATLDAERAILLIQQIALARDQAAVVELLECTKVALGAEQAFFASFVRDDDDVESFRFMLACDPVWCMTYQKQAWYANDPWLLYAMNSTEPICASTIPLHTKMQRQTQELAAQFGMVSVYIVPAPSSGGVSRLGVLCLGSPRPGHFEAASSGVLKILARSLAMELHEWWVRQVRSEIIASHHVTPDELELLACERRGLSSKQIAELLGLSSSSIDSRFQRLNAKFCTPSRRVAARMAAEYGLI